MHQDTQPEYITNYPQFRAGHVSHNSNRSPSHILNLLPLWDFSISRKRQTLDNETRIKTIVDPNCLNNAQDFQVMAHLPQRLI